MALGDVLWVSKSWSHPNANRAYIRGLELAEELEEAIQTAMALRALLVAALGRAQFALAQGLGERRGPARPEQRRCFGSRRGISGRDRLRARSSRQILRTAGVDFLCSVAQLPGPFGRSANSAR
jgi:hypothetical protein